MTKKFYEENLKWDILTKNLVTFTKKKAHYVLLVKFCQLCTKPLPLVDICHNVISP